MCKADKLIISPESVHKLWAKKNKRLEFDLIIIDESESVLGQFMSEDD